ncbi:MAG: hypothetical protein ACRDGS_11420 [Chloroflexota bacterium]
MAKWTGLSWAGTKSGSLLPKPFLLVEMIRFPLRVLALRCVLCGIAVCEWPAAFAARSGLPRRAHAATNAGSPVYVAIGASDSVGYGVRDPATQGWVPRFAAVRPGHPKLVNLGVVGFTLHQAVLVDLPVWSTASRPRCW